MHSQKRASPNASPKRSARIQARSLGQRALPTRSFSSSGPSELSLPSIGDKIQSLVTLVGLKYTSTLPHSYTPRRDAVDSLRKSQDSSLFDIIETLKTSTVDDNGCLDVNLSDLDNVRYDKMMLRKSYFRLAEMMIENFNKRGQKKSLLIGSPGTGTSMFLIFLLYIFVNCENVPIVVHFWKFKGFYFNGRFYAIKSFAKFCAGIGRYNPIFLYDGNFEPPIIPRSPTVVASSPRINRYRDYRKEKTKYLMPLWKRSEIIRLNSCLEGEECHLTDNELADRFKYAGGVPRVIFFTPKKWKDYCTDVKLALGKIEPSILVGEGEGALEDGPHTVIGIRVNAKNYGDFRCCFLSRQIKNDAVEALKSKNKNLVEYVFNEVESGRKTGLLFEVFKDLALEELCKKHLRSLIPLNDIARKQLALNSNRILNLQKASIIPIGSVHEVVVDYPAPILWAPTSERFPVVDYIYTQPAPRGSRDRNPIVIGFQMTVRDRHPLNWACLGDLYELFGDQLELVFALPKTVYGKFTEQRQVLGDNNQSCSVEDIIPVAQYKTCCLLRQ